MRAHRATSYVILGIFLALAVLAFLGDRVLFAIYVVVAGAVLVHHAVSLCPRCSNLACAFNPRTRTTGAPVPPDASAGDATYSDLPITRTTVVPLLLVEPLALYAAWRFSPVATIVFSGVALAAHQVFRKQTCTNCGNDCAGNCNGRYREWRRARTESGAQA
ncbi:MAG TPA: hypothetical protein VF902_03815 [Coriobacteriia bacterium]